MLHFMRDVRKVSALRFQLFDIFQRAFQPKVGLMRANTQAVEHQHFEIAETFNGRGRNLAQVSGVSKVIEAIRDHRQASVNDFQRSYFQTLADTEWRAIYHGVRNYLRQPAAKMGGLEDILKNAADVFPRAFVGIQP